MKTKKVIVEVKPRLLIVDNIVQAKAEAAKIYCKVQALEFRFWCAKNDDLWIERC